MHRLLLLAALIALPASAQPLLLPYADAGLTERQAAAHALDRLAYGPRPGDVDRLAATGLDVWIEAQIAGAFDDDALEAELAEQFPSTALPLREMGATYPSPAVRLRAFRGMQNPERAGERGGREGGAERMGRSEGRADGRARTGGPRRARGMGADSVRTGGGQQALIDDLVNARLPEPGSRQARVADAAERRFGFGDLRTLFYDATSSKLLRAVYAENQLEEVLTDFWFNHFNVSLGKINDAGPFVPAFERDAVRPHVLGSFRDLLEAATLHPAMLFYLDNHRSNADSTRRTLAPAPPPREAMGGGQNQQRAGVNENFARELFELHTLGVDGGYAQRDVEEAARVLTGWKVNPLVYPLPDEMRRQIERRLDRASAETGEGYLFDPRRHDAEAKEVLGTAFPAGGGAADLDRLLDAVAYHPSTARHLSFKLAQKFVRDDPPAALVDDLAAAYLASGGDLADVMRALVQHPAFWAPEAVAAKIKTPLETVASAVRAVGADVDDAGELVRWTTRMGQPLYAYDAPTGYPETAASWVGGAALLNRMNFGMELAAGQVEGVRVDLHALGGGPAPGGPDDALRSYLPLILPGRDTDETAALLHPALHAPDARLQTGSADPLAQVVGLILGSPEFQRQ